MNAYGFYGCPFKNLGETKLLLQKILKSNAATPK
jgi:hypothetical protein